jgi:hypothetical protein
MVYRYLGSWLIGLLLILGLSAVGRWSAGPLMT